MISYFAENLTKCFGYQNKHLYQSKNKKALMDWYPTSGDCPNNAIVLVTRSGRNICANPKDKKVMKAVRYLQKHMKSPNLAFQES